MTKRTLPQTGQRYRIFQDRLCQIVTLATDSETGEDLVVYQALYDDFKVYVRPLSLFMSEVTETKDQSAIKVDSESSAVPPAEPLPEGISPKLMEFLDADTDDARYKIVSEMADIVDDHMIDTMAVVLDVVIDDGPIDQRYQELKNCIRTRMRYEINRFR